MLFFDAAKFGHRRARSHYFRMVASGRGGALDEEEEAFFAYWSSSTDIQVERQIMYIASEFDTDCETPAEPAEPAEPESVSSADGARRGKKKRKKKRRPATTAPPEPEETPEAEVEQVEPLRAVYSSLLQLAAEEEGGYVLPVTGYRLPAAPTALLDEDGWPCSAEEAEEEARHGGWSARDASAVMECRFIRYAVMDCRFIRGQR